MGAITVMAFLVYILDQVSGHARLLEPPSRSSMWRDDRFQGLNPADYNDNQGFCGGFSVQFNSINNGQCGICGDRADLQEREHEAPGGKYANGIIVQNYLIGQQINVTVEVTANHMGFFTFRLCPNNNITHDPGQECFDRPEHLLKVLPDLTDKFPLPTGLGKMKVSLQLPQGVECEQCVLQWTYTSGNNWGTCTDGTGALGCGNQEHFRACADISIGEEGGTITVPTIAASTSSSQPSTTTTFSSTTSSSVSSTSESSSSNCVPVYPYTSVPGMLNWCNTNCNLGYCPPSHCICQ